MFTISIVAFPWIGWALDRQTGAAGQQESLAWLLFILTPFLAAVLLRLLGDGWKDAGLMPRLLQNGRWYAFALFLGALITGAFFQVAPGWDAWLSPAWTSLASILIFALAG